MTALQEKTVPARQQSASDAPGGTRKICSGAWRAWREEMELPIEKIQNVAFVQLPIEELDASNAAEFKHDMAPILESEANVVLDLARVRFVDSSGLGAFLSCLRRVNERGGDLKLCGMSKAVRGVFELVRMHRVFEIHPSREAAQAAFVTSADRGDRGDRGDRATRSAEDRGTSA
jgi:anti-sigma B factor antagonist